MAKAPIAISTVRLYAICAFFALGSFIWGYNVGILSTILVHPGFKKALGNPTASQTGVITAIFYLGTWLGYVFISYRAIDAFGRRYAALGGAFVACVGAAFLAGASGGPSGAYAMMTVGRIIAGLGISVVSTSVPLYQAEIAPSAQRGKLVVMNHVGVVAGSASAFWVGYGVSHWKTKHGQHVGWRMSIALEFVPAVIFMVGLPFVPETPRWLIMRGRFDEAAKSLRFFRAGAFTDDEIEVELNEMKRGVSTLAPARTRWLELFQKRGLFQRLWRAALLQFMSNVCGATAMKYYLPTLFRKLGIEYELSLMVSGIESTLKIGCTIMEMLIVDRLGRTNTMVAGTSVMALAMLVNGALPLAYPNNVNHASDYACIAFIFLSGMGYSLGFGPGAWVYGSEIFPMSHRAVGLNVAASFASLGSIIVAQVWPVGIQNIGSKTYFIFMAINLACIPVIILLYPETKKRSLENIDGLFDHDSRPSMETDSAVVYGDTKHDIDAKGVELSDRQEYRSTGVCDSAIPHGDTKHNVDAKVVELSAGQLDRATDI